MRVEIGYPNCMFFFFDKIWCGVLFLQDGISGFKFMIPKYRSRSPQIAAFAPSASYRNMIWRQRMEFGSFYTRTHSSRAKSGDGAVEARVNSNTSTQRDTTRDEAEKVLRWDEIRGQLFFPDRRLVQFDCGKLQQLAVLLKGLKSSGHRCLIFAQMSKMLDILEHFINLYG